jgi:hypothetical protein
VEVAGVAAPGRTVGRQSANVSIESEAMALAVMLCGTNSIASPRAMILRVGGFGLALRSVFARERGAVARALVLAGQIAGSGFFERASSADFLRYLQRT